MLKIYIKKRHKIDWRSTHTRRQQMDDAIHGRTARPRNLNTAASQRSKHLLFFVIF